MIELPFRNVLLCFFAGCLMTLNATASAASSPQITPAQKLQVSQGTNNIYKLAVVTDQETPADSIKFFVNSTPGFTISEIKNLNGEMSARIQIDCGLETGFYQLELVAIDADENRSAAKLSVEIIAAQAPVLSAYPNTTLATKTSAQIKPATPLNPDSGITSLTVTGFNISGLTIDNRTGVITVPAGIVPGSYLVIVRAEGVCGKVTTRSFTLSVTGIPSCNFLTFQNPISFYTPLNTYELMTGDLNNDGFPDLVTVHDLAHSVSIHLNNGKGVFQTKVTIPVGNNPKAAAIGDINADNHADLLISNTGAGTVSVLLGNGDGTFTEGALLNGFDFPTTLALGDFNGDKRVDCVVANSGGYNVQIRYGLGDGNFAPVPTMLMNHFPVDVQVGDFDRDGLVDIAALGSASNAISIYWNQADGEFLQADYYIGNGPTSFVTGNFNDDEQIDFAAVSYETGTMRVLLNLNQRTFVTGREFPAGNLPTKIIRIDFNEDLLDDLLVLNQGSPYYSILQTQSNQTYGFERIDIPSPINLRTAHYADLNNDSRADLLLVDYWARQIFYYSGSCLATPPASIRRSIIYRPDDGRGKRISPNRQALQ